MFRDYFTNKWIIGGFLLLLVFAGLCALWLRHETTEIQKQEAVNDEFRRHLIQSEKVDADKETEQAADGSVESTTSTTEKNTNPDTRLPKETNTTETKNRGFFLTDDIYIGPKPPPIPVSKDQLVSPYGFGPYPELPEGFGPITWPREDAESELMIRVEIKLLNEGVSVEGVAMEDSLVYPIIKGTCYVRWGETSNGRRYLREALGHPDDDDYIEAIEKEKKQRRESVTASDFPGIKMIPYEEGGIDPYTFLDLPK